MLNTILSIAAFVGSIVASGLYGVMRAAKFHTAVAGQDGDDAALVMRDRQGAMIGFVSAAVLCSGTTRADTTFVCAG